MTSAPNTPLVCVELMTNRQHGLAGVLWRHAPGNATGLQAWLASDDYKAVAERVPCVWEATTTQAWPEPMQQLLADTRSRTAGPESFLHSGTEVPTQWPAHVEWSLGRWYTQPPAKPTAAQAASRSTALQLLQLVANDADTHEIEEVFRHDATLSYQLLRIVNSLAMGGQRQITSFGQAILMMGRQPLRRWLHLLLFAARDDDARSSLLMAHVILRARGLELLACEAGMDRAGQDQAFMAGMFSMLGVLFGLPLEQVLRPLQLSDEALDALLHHQGTIGQLLDLWEAMENASPTLMAERLAQTPITASTFNQVLLQACDWMLNITLEHATA